MPSFNGVDFFGLASVSLPRPMPNDLQITAFPGLSGLDVKNCGSRGATIEVAGLLIAANPALLGITENTFWGYLRAATVAAFVDSRGQVYPHATLIEFEPAEELKPYDLAGTNKVSMYYRARFLILD